MHLPARFLASQSRTTQSSNTSGAATRVARADVPSANNRQNLVLFSYWNLPSLFAAGLRPRAYAFVDVLARVGGAAAGVAHADVPSANNRHGAPRCRI